MLLSELENRNIGLLGAGREGRSVWRALRRLYPGQALTIYCESEPRGEFAEAFGDRHDRLVIGPLDGPALARHEILVRSPGISPYREELQAARTAGVAITTATEIWFAEHPQANTICITGTKGKSTTAALTAHLLEAAGKNVRLGGNIGEPLMDCRGAGPDWWVIELSSYQLAGLKARPSIGVILNVSDAHLDWHKGRAAYRADKLRLADLVEGRPLVLNGADRELRERFGERDGVTWFNRVPGLHVSKDALYRDDDRIVQLPAPGLHGAHDLANLAGALTAVELAGVSIADPAGALSGFEGLPHRLQGLGSRHGLEYVNDSLATTPVATLAALTALSGGAVTLLFGGEDSEVDWDSAITGMQDVLPHAIIALPDSGPELADRMERTGLRPAGGIHIVPDLAEAVRLASKLTPPGGTVLLSPGAPSFPQFRNYEERGREFARLAGLSE